MSKADSNGWKAQQYEKLKARIVELESENQNLLMANRKRCRDILDAIARKVAAGETVTIAPDWGLGSGTLVMEDESHTHFGLDIYEDEGQSVDSFVEGLHSLLVEGRGLSVAGGKVEDLPSPFLDRGDLRARLKVLERIAYDLAMLVSDHVTEDVAWRDAAMGAYVEYLSKPNKQ